jgi:hypothetical protein
MSAGRPRVRPALRRIAILALVVLVPMAAHRVWDHIELRRLVREIEEIRAKGEPVTLRDTAGQSAPLGTEESRGALYYLAAGLVSPSIGSYPIGGLLVVHSWMAGATGRPPSLAGTVDELRTTAERARDALALADAGAALPFRGFPPGTEYSYRAQTLAQVSLAMSARTMSLSLDGDGDGAVESALSALQFRRSERDVRLLRLGDHDTAGILSFSSPSAAQLVRLQRALEAEDNPDRPIDELHRSRARYLEQLWRRYYGSDPSAPQAYLLPTRSVGETIMRPWLSRRISHTLQIWADVLDAARTPWPLKQQAAENVRRRYEAEVNPAAGPEWLTLSDAMPVVWWGPAIALEQLRQGAVVRPAAAGPLHGPGQLIVDRSARIAVGIERYRRDQGGALPDTLAELVPQYLSEIPADPLTGASLRYRVEPGAYRVYSIGTDGTDDGGTLLEPAPVGSARSFSPGPDIGVRVLIR